MNLNIAEAAALVESLIGDFEAKSTADVVLCPNFLAIPKVKELVRNTPIKVGAQNVFWLDSGAYTGHISPKMLSHLCIDFCIVGHSETRGRFGSLEIPESTIPFFAETDETINLKIKALLFHAITPILCVGETLEERNDNQTEAVISKQLDGALAGLDPAELYGLVIAYEPVWAIGTGQTCETQEANRVCSFVRSCMQDRGGSDLSENVRVLYGGSVKASNAQELFSQPDIDGGLVGGASLEADGFARIVMSAKP